MTPVSLTRRPTLRIGTVGVALGLAGFVGPSLVAPSLTAGTAPVGGRTGGMTLTTAASTTSSPPTTLYCRHHFGYDCYSPLQLRHAYQVGKVGYDGSGTTIAIVDSFGSPTIKHDLAVFDQAFGLPAPPSFRIVRPAGPVQFDSGNSTIAGWALETTLDVEYAHAMAPGAHIILAETPTAETEGVHGFPDMMKSEQWLVRHTNTTVISQSFNATEETFPSRSSLMKLRYAYKEAVRHHVTLLAASGDTGVTNYRKDMSLYNFRVTGWPSTDPLVTSVGGTQLSLDTAGNRRKPDRTWHDFAGASGGGRSEFFSRPGYQDHVRSVVGGRRGTPDISLNAAAKSSVDVFASYGGHGRWYLVSGTSEATPLFAGIVAMAADRAGHRLGRINPTLYAMHGATADGLVDVKRGNNSWHGVTGFAATPGYDMATGWGTLDAPKFVSALAAGPA